MAESFEVIDQRQTWIPGIGARFDQVMEITVKTKPSGIVRMLDVPLDRYNALSPEQLHDLIAPLAADAEAKHSI